MKSIQAINFIVQKDKLQNTKIIEKSYPAELDENQVLFEIDFFSLTSNNITYGVIGEKIGYWQFFPTEDGYGIIPAWGFANVIQSTHPEVKLGQRFYGYYPMGSHLLVNPDKISANGFVDAKPHRRALPPIYNYYANIEVDPTISPDSEKLISIFRPLFATSFLIDDHLAKMEFFKASQIVLTSASSKTAMALVCLLAHRKKTEGLEVNIIGLTSKSNMDFVNELGWYDQVLDYEEIDQLNSNQKHVVVDFTGNHQTQFDLQTALGDQLAYNCLVGLVDWQHMRGEQKLPKKGEFFFAPTYAEKRQKEWGVAELNKRLGLSWLIFAQAVQPRIEIKDFSGPESLTELYSDMLMGKIDPSQGNVVSLTN